MKFGERLLQAGLIDRAQLDAALSHQRETGQRLGEALLELGYVGEENLLRFLAKEFNTRFVSTRKLARISASTEMLELVPQPVAEQNNLFPVMLNRSKSLLGLVTSDPQNVEVVAELRIITGLENIQVFVAVREAIQAAIKKYYKGDIHAFSALDRSGQSQADEAMDLYSDRVIEPDALREEVRPTSKQPAIVDLDPADGFTSEGTSSWTRQIEAVRGGSLVSDNDFIETLNILVGLLEMQRTQLQGHSAKVARLTKAVSERLGLKERDINHNIIAAYLHDLGKRASVHLTLMSIARSEDHRRRARRYHLTPARLFDSVHLPPQVNHVIGHLYESFDGTGLPEQLSGQGIPTGARIIAVVDAYLDLVDNPVNPLGRLLGQEEALAELGRKSERLFDPQLVEMLAEVVRGEQSRSVLSASSPLVLVADPDNASTSVIELKLVKQGFRVRVARDSQTAEESLRAEPVAALLVEMRLEPKDGFQLLKQLQIEGRALPVFMVAADPPPEAITRAFKDGVVDFITKPFVPEVIIAKLQKELASRGQPDEAAMPAAPDIDFSAPAAGVGEGEEEEEDIAGVVIHLEDDLSSALAEAEQAMPGGLAEDDADGSGPPADDEATPTPTAWAPGAGEEAGMPAPPTGTLAGVVSTGAKILSGTLEGRTALALIRALSGKRKTGLLSLRRGEEKGMIYFEKGHVFQALVGEAQAEEAFLELAAWQDCLYKFDPSKTAKARSINTPTGKLIQIAGLS